MKKPINHLASLVERQSHFQFPHQQKLQQLFQITEHIRQAWMTALPLDVINTLIVTNYDEFSLTISTNNHTVANHLNYSAQPLLNFLHQYQSSFQSIRTLKFHVIILDKMAKPTQLGLQCHLNVNNVTSCELSNSTKQTISQLAEIVTDDERLSNALHQLIK